MDADLGFRFYLVRMSAIDFFCSVDKVKGVDGKERVVLTFDGKYLPHTEHVSHILSVSLVGPLCTWFMISLRQCGPTHGLLRLKYSYS